MSVSTVDYDLDWSSSWDLYQTNHWGDIFSCHFVATNITFIFKCQISISWPTRNNESMRHFKDGQHATRLKTSQPQISCHCKISVGFNQSINIYIVPLQVRLVHILSHGPLCSLRSSKIQLQRNMIQVSFSGHASSLALLRSIFLGNQKTTDNRRRGIIFKRKTLVCGMLSFSCVSNAIPCSLSHLNSSSNGFQI